jgi:hypothetical protein
MNIVRATYSEPLQFTDISSAQGTSQTEGTISAGVPFPFRGGFGTLLPQQFITPQPSVKSSGTTQFTMANLNNQEFYNGIQTQLSLQQIATYLSSGFDPYVLLLLSVSEIEIRQKGRRVIFKNNVKTRDDFRIFYTVIRSFLDAGLSAEQIDTSTWVGPALSEKEAKAILPDFIKATATDPLSLRPKGGSTFQVSKQGGRPRLCFDPIRASSAQRVRGREIYVVDDAARLPQVILGYDGPDRPAVAAVTLTPADACGGSKAKNDADASLDRTIFFRLRSVEGMFQYLGALSRQQLGLVSSAAPDFSFGGLGYNLFELKRGGGAFQVSHRGEVFGVDVDPTGTRDGSSRTLQLLTSLLAQQSSAKAFPSQNVITVVGQ